MVYESRFEDLVREASGGPRSIQLFLDVDGDYEEQIAAYPTTPLDLDYSGDDIYIIYTGGTTGMPKGVMWPQEDALPADARRQAAGRAEAGDDLRGRGSAR